MRTRTVLRLCVLLGPFLATCKGSQTAPETARVASIQIAPNPVTLVVDTTLRLEATLRDHSGNPLSGRRLFWASEDSSVASVSAEGVVSTRSAGAVRVAASAEGVDALATVVVTERPVASVVVSPEGAAIAVGEAVLLTATARDPAGRALGGRTVRWTSRDARIAGVGPDGQVVGMAPGRAEITATVEEISASAVVDVSPQPVATVEITPSAAALLLGSTLRFGATARARDGTALDGRGVAWSSSDATVVSVSPTGLATARALGAATVTATVEGRSASAGVGVGLQPVASVAVDPGSVTLEIGAGATLSATTRAADGTVLSGRVVVWSSADPSIARVDPSGRVTGVAPGTVQVRAGTEGRSGSATVTVKNRTVAAVEIEPTAATLAVGGTRQFGATARASDGTVLSGRGVAWSSSDASVVRISAGGLATAAAPGTATITATVEGRSATAAVSVSAVSVAAVEVSPASVRLDAGDTSTLQAVVRGGDGAALSGRTVTWSSSAPGVVLVDAAGRVTAVAAGEATVTATSEGKRGSASIHVVARPAQILIVGGNGQSGRNNRALDAPLAVRVLDAGGRPVPGVVVRWSTDNGSTAPAESRTDAQGTASTTWTLGGGPRGTRSATAAVGALKVQFTATRT